MRRWEVSCDKLRLFAMGNFGPEALDAWGTGRALAPESDGKRRGALASRFRAGKVPGWGGEPVFIMRRTFAELHGAELHVEFNPRLQGAEGLRHIAEWMRVACGVDPLAAEVVRCDVAHDMYGVEREGFRLDAGRRGIQNKRSPCGRLEGEWSGYVKGCKRKVRLYDKQAERLAVGAEDPGKLVRFELEGHAPFERVTDAEGSPPGTRPLRVRDLAELAWPADPGYGVREFLRPVDDYGDDRYWLLVRAAAAVGTRWAELQSRLVLPRAGAEVLRSCCWPLVEPSPREAFERQWGAVAGAVVAGLAASRGTLALQEQGNT